MKKSKKQKQSIKKTLATTKFMLGLVWGKRQGRLYILVKFFMSILNAIFPLAYVVMPGLIINELMGEKDIERLCFLVGILIFTPLCSHLAGMFANIISRKLSLSLTVKFDSEFFMHELSMDYDTIEKPDIQIQKDRAYSTLSGVLNTVNLLAALLTAIFGLIAISSIIVSLNIFIIVLIVIIIIIKSFATKWANRKKFEIGKELSVCDRYEWGTIYMIEQLEYAKEIRLFDLRELLINLYKNQKKKSNKISEKLETTAGISGTVHALMGVIQQGALYAYLIYKVIYQSLQIGTMTIYLSTAGQFSRSLSQVFSAYLGLAGASYNIEELQKFLAIPLKQQESGDKIPVFRENSVIEFKNVSFKYPGSKNYALKNMNLKISFNEKLCIVGVNGSGKSTFIKLLTRLYFPDEGEILLDGVNINEFDYKKYHQLFAPVFQDYAKYYMSLRENIVLANESDYAKLGEVSELCGLSALAGKLPKGYETQVEKLLDPEGFIPSGGEEQRIAIARARYHASAHGSPIYLLDEPTAALDPMKEYEIYKQFNDMISDKTSVIITHRLSAVQLSDKIAVFKEGHCTEYGTHDELYKNGGEYAEMFDKQAEFYRK